MVLVVIFPLPDEKNVDVKTIFTCSQTCSRKMKPRVLVCISSRRESHLDKRQPSIMRNTKSRLQARSNYVSGSGGKPAPSSKSRILLLTKFLERRDLVFDRRSSSTGPCP